MKNKAYLLVAFICLVASSCKKDAPKQQIQAEQIQALEAGLIHFSINGELLGANIDTVLNTITAIIPAALNKQSLTVNFSVASQVTAALNKVAVSSGTIVDFSIPVVLTVTSADRKRTTSFVVNIITDQEYIGLTGTLIAGKSLNKNYLFYLDQFDGSTWQAINCGPTVTTMAL